MRSIIKYHVQHNNINLQNRFTKRGELGRGMEMGIG